MRRATSILLTLCVAFTAICWAAPACAGIVDLRVTGAGQRVEYVGIGGTTHYVDGWVYNAAGVGNNCTDIAITASAKSAGGATLATVVFPLPIHVLSASTSQYFHMPLSAPAGTDHWDMTATGASTPFGYVGTFPTWVRTTDSAGRRVYSASLPTNAGSISSLIAAGAEDANTVNDSDSADFLDTMIDYSHAYGVYGPWRVLSIRMVGLRSTAMPFIFHLGGANWVPYTPQTVHRFFNRRNGSHFYTADESERARVAGTLTSTYVYDGPAYHVNTTNPSNMRPLYRFYNRRNGSHFYTVDPAERDRVRSTLARTYSYDGPAYNVSTFPWFSQPVYRFFNRRNGSHFYTVDIAERNRVMTTLTSTYTYEGIGFYIAY